MRSFHCPFARPDPLPTPPAASRGPARASGARRWSRPIARLFRDPRRRILLSAGFLGGGCCSRFLASVAFSRSSEGASGAPATAAASVRDRASLEDCAQTSIVTRVFGFAGRDGGHVRPPVPARGHLQLADRRGAAVEGIGALALLTASIFFFLAWRRARARNERGRGAKVRRLSLLLLAIAFLVGFGEEISWGQRLLGIDTPSEIKDSSSQEELNFHNLKFFAGGLDPDKLFQLFWFSFGVLIPVMAAVSRRARDFLGRYLPIVPLVVSAALVTNQPSTTRGRRTSTTATSTPASRSRTACTRPRRRCRDRVRARRLRVLQAAWSYPLRGGRGAQGRSCSRGPAQRPGAA